MVGVGVAVGANQQQANTMQNELTAITKAVQKTRQHATGQQAIDLLRLIEPAWLDELPMLLPQHQPQAAISRLKCLHSLKAAVSVNYCRDGGWLLIFFRCRNSVELARIKSNLRLCTSFVTAQNQ